MNDICYNEIVYAWRYAQAMLNIIWSIDVFIQLIQT